MEGRCDEKARDAVFMRDFCAESCGLCGALGVGRVRSAGVWAIWVALGRPALGMAPNNIILGSHA